MGEFCQPVFSVDYDRMRTDFLCPAPSHLSGIGRLLDLLGLFALYNVSPTGREADCRALFSDWVMVGRDIRDAVTTYEVEHPLRR